MTHSFNVLEHTEFIKCLSFDPTCETGQGVPNVKSFMQIDK